MNLENHWQGLRRQILPFITEEYVNLSAWARSRVKNFANVPTPIRVNTTLWLTYELQNLGLELYSGSFDSGERSVLLVHGSTFNSTAYLPGPNYELTVTIDQGGLIELRIPKELRSSFTKMHFEGKLQDAVEFIKFYCHPMIDNHKIDNGLITTIRQHFLRAGLARD